MHLKIEPVKSEELSLLVEVSRRTFYDTFHAQNTKEDMDRFLDTTFTAGRLQFEMSQPFNYFFFAKWDNQLAGYLKLSTEGLPGSDNTQGMEISRIYVIKEKLALGIGKALLEFSISFAKQMDKKTIYLGVWERNARAIRFYQNFGFTKFDEHIFMVGNDPQTDWLMKRDVEL